MCYVHNQWYDISCATLYFVSFKSDENELCNSDSLLHSQLFVTICLVVPYAWLKILFFKRSTNHLLSITLIISIVMIISITL